jgi:hypothetical protein
MPGSRAAAPKIEEITDNGDQKPEEAPAEAQPKPAAVAPPALPTTKTVSSGELVDKMTVIHGPAGVGKSTLASQWAGGNIFFFNCAGELGELEVYQQSIPNWREFLSYAWSVAEASVKGENQFSGCAIDTSDVLGSYCAERVRQKLGIVHESDLDYGKGWNALRDEWHRACAKLAAIPNFGVVHVTHSTEVEVKTRSAQWNKQIPRGSKGIREVMVDMADLVLFVDYAENDEEKRVIRTKPSRYWEAKERGQNPRLPAEIEWPLGENGWEIINAAWDQGGKK